jgi:uncharacterized Zn finger protein (UPF0148 family)
MRTCKKCGYSLIKKNNRFVCVNCGDLWNQDGQDGQDRETRRRERKERERSKWGYYNKDTYSK